jgi:hypothetical protein
LLITPKKNRGNYRLTVSKSQLGHRGRIPNSRFAPDESQDAAIDRLSCPPEALKAYLSFAIWHLSFCHLEKPTTLMKPLAIGQMINGK